MSTKIVSMKFVNAVDGNSSDFIKWGQRIFPVSGEDVGV